MSLSRRELRGLRSAGWEVVEDGPAIRVRQMLRWLATGRTSTPKVTVVRTRRRSR